MSYSLNPAEPLDISIRAIGADQIDKALVSLDRLKEEPDEAIHDIRKRLKKLRALIRLCRKEVGEEYYQERNASFRDAGRKLSNLRDLSVMQSSLQDLHEHYREGLKAQVFNGIARKLNQEKEEERREKITEGNLATELAQVLEAEKAELENWPLNTERFYHLVPAIRKVYKRGYKAFHIARKKPDPANKHEWRKRVKYLWYHFRLLKQFWPNMWERYAKEWHQLGHILGDDHDLATLGHKTGEEVFRQEEKAACKLLDGLLVKEVKELEESAFLSGKRLFAEDPAAFAKRIKQVIKAAEKAA